MFQTEGQKHYNLQDAHKYEYEVPESNERCYYDKVNINTASTPIWPSEASHTQRQHERG